MNKNKKKTLLLLIDVIKNQVVLIFKNLKTVLAVFTFLLSLLYSKLIWNEVDDLRFGTPVSVGISILGLCILVSTMFYISYLLWKEKK